MFHATVGAAAVGALMAGSPAWAQPVVRASSQTLTLQILPGSAGGLLGPDGRHHDTVVPSTFTVPVGAIIHLRIVNHDMMKHSIVQPELGLDIVARPARLAADAAMTKSGPMAMGGAMPSNAETTPVVTVATFSVLAPGRYRWHCTEPCDDGAAYWAMSSARPGRPDAGRPGRDGFMAGYIVAR